MSSRAKTIKRIVAREGLIIVGLVALFFLTSYLNTLFFNSRVEECAKTRIDSEMKEAKLRLPEKTKVPLEFLHFTHQESYNLCNNSARFSHPRYFETTVYFIIFFYPLYWLVRFIIWAIKTLREK